MKRNKLLFVFFISLFFIFPNLSISQNEIWDSQFITANAPADTVFAVTTDGTNIYIGGKFTSVAGISANYVAMWDGAAWYALGTGMNATVRTLVFDNGNLYAGGDFTIAGGNTVNHLAVWDGTIWTDIGTGTDSTVKEIMIKDGNVYIGGDFTNAGGVTVNNIAFWDGSVWNALGSGTNGSVNALAMDGVNIYAGGNFTNAGGVANTNYIAVWNGTSWAAMSSGTNGTVHDIIYLGPSVLIGGEFTAAGATTVNFLTKWDGSTFSSFGTGANGNVYCLEQNNSDVYIGGNFTNIDGVAANNIALYNSTVWSALGDGTDNIVYAMQQKGYELHIGGAFLNAGLKSSEYFARLMSLPVFTTHPANTEACLNDTVVFTISAEGTEPMTYQWQLDGVDITGATDTFLIITGVSPLNAGLYKCVVTNPVGSVSSNNAQLVVHLPPSFILQPSDSSTCEQESISFNISVSSTTPVSYQWQYNLLDIAGETSTTYTINSLAIADSGNYNCIATNTCGSVSSDTAYLSVHPLPNVVISGLDTSYCVDSPVDTLQGIPYGGIFSGIGMTDSIFDPTGIIGIHYITYTYTTTYGCTGSDSLQFEGHDLPAVSFTGLLNTYCLESQEDTLWATPADGLFTGQGIMNDFIFYPDIAGAGYHQITYFYTDKWGCSNSDTNYTTVYDMPAVNVGADTNICMGDSLILTITGDFGMYGWFFTSEINTSVVVNPVSDTSYAGWIMNSFGCTSVDTINVTVNPLPTGISFSGLDAEYCNTAPPDTLYGTPAGGNFMNPEIAGNILYPTLFSAGIHQIIYQYTDSNLCSAYDTNTTNIKPVVDVSFTGYNVWYCENSAGDTLIPNPPGGFFTGGNITDSVFIPSVAGTGTHNIVYNYIDTNGCTAYDTVAVVVFELPVINLTNDTGLCEGDTLMIVADCPDALTYNWSNSQSNDTVFVSPFTTTTYYLTVTNSSCYNTDSITVTVNPVPIVDLGGDSDMCREQYLNAGAGYAVYSWSDTTVTDSILPVEQSGLYSVTVTTFEGCTATDSATITILPTPDVNLGTDITITTDQTVIIGTSGIYESYLWSTGDTASMIVAEGDSLGIGDHVFWVEASTTNGCTDSDTIIVTVIYGLYVNNIQTGDISIYPNPAQDYLYIKIKDINASNIDIDITDLSGKLIYNKTIENINNDFGYKIDLQNQPGGIYMLHLKTDKFIISRKIILF